VSEVITDESPPVLRYEPQHPDADEDGYVAYPDIKPLEEMANFMAATRSYEANVRAFEAVKELVRRSLELGS
jgi:flagellar basal-body rod protein FlgC